MAVPWDLKSRVRTLNEEDLLLAPRIELGWPYDRGILSPLRLPIPPCEHIKKVNIRLDLRTCKPVHV
jgi:hypothetical protein